MQLGRKKLHYFSYSVLCIELTIKTEWVFSELNAIFLIQLENFFKLQTQLILLIITFLNSVII
jgi:hypothetical protein